MEATQATASTGGLTPPAITQDELAEYRRQQGIRRDLDRSLEARRRKLMRLFESGADVEPGPLTCYVAQQDQIRVTSSEIERLLGEEVLAELKTQIVPTTTRTLHVVDDYLHNRPA